VDEIAYMRLSVVERGQRWMKGKTRVPSDEPRRMQNCRMGVPERSHLRGQEYSATSRAVVVANMIGVDSELLELLVRTECPVGRFPIPNSAERGLA
jgi:hypothetical protein